MIDTRTERLLTAARARVLRAEQRHARVVAHGLRHGRLWRALSAHAAHLAARQLSAARAEVRALEVAALLGDYERLTGQPWGQPLDEAAIRARVAEVAARMGMERGRSED